MDKIIIPFPYSERVVYPHNPLIEVVFEIKFAEIKTSEGKYEAFKSPLNERFVDFEVNQITDLEVEISGHEQPLIKQNQKEVLSAFDKNKVWSINLTKNTMSISTKKYNNWEEFKETVQASLASLTKTYNVKVYSRLGLRYRNIIDKVNLELDKYSWNELISDELIGILDHLDQPDDDFVENNNIFRLKISQAHDFVRVNHGFIYNKENRKAYAIDSDFSHQKEQEVDNDSIIRRLELYHSGAGQLFRWGTKDILHKRLINPPSS